MGGARSGREAMPPSMFPFMKKLGARLARIALGVSPGNGCESQADRQQGEHRQSNGGIFLHHG